MLAWGHWQKLSLGARASAPRLPPPGSSGATALWSSSSESLPVKHLTFKLGRGGEAWSPHAPASSHPPDPHNPTHPLLVHPRSSLLTHADRMRGITAHLNNLTVQALGPGSDIACFCLCAPTNEAVTLRTEYQGILFVLLFIAMHAPPCDWGVHLFQAGPAWIPFCWRRIFACISQQIFLVTNKKNMNVTCYVIMQGILMFLLLSFNSVFLNIDKNNIIQTLNVLFKFEIVLGPNKRIIKWSKLPFMSFDVSWCHEKIPLIIFYTIKLIISRKLLRETNSPKPKWRKEKRSSWRNSSAKPTRLLIPTCYWHYCVLDTVTWTCYYLNLCTSWC